MHGAPLGSRIRSDPSRAERHDPNLPSLSHPRRTATESAATGTAERRIQDDKHGHLLSNSLLLRSAGQGRGGAPYGRNW